MYGLLIIFLRLKLRENIDKTIEEYMSFIQKKYLFFVLALFLSGHLMAMENGNDLNTNAIVPPPPRLKDVFDIGNDDKPKKYSANAIKNSHDLKSALLESKHPITFTGASNFHFLGTEEAIYKFQFLHNPGYSAHFLQKPEIAHQIRSLGGSAAMMFFDEEIENIMRSYGVSICFPPSEVRQAIEHKCEGNRIAQKALIEPAPYILAKINSYSSLQQKANEAQLGNILVVQTPKGNSGKGTFFISTNEDYKCHADVIEAASEVRIMKRLKAPRSICIEACIAQNGIIVGIPANDLVGIPELTPNPCGWCGNEIGQELFSNELIRYIRSATQKIGETIKQRHPKAWGYFGVDWLLENGKEKPVFGEINMRITGMAMHTNRALLKQIGVSLFHFHLAEYLSLPVDIDIDELNKNIGDISQLENWSCMIVKHRENQPVQVLKLPDSGIFKLEGSNAVFCRFTKDFSLNSGEALWFPETVLNGFLNKEDLLGRIVLKDRITSNNGSLTQSAIAWIEAMRKSHTLVELTK